MYNFYKRFFDFLISIFAIFLLLPLLLFLCILIFLFDFHFPIFFQIRSGYNAKPFTIFKFKTMKNNRITKLGLILRNYKLDELPQLFNILFGSMSLVGPRPLYLEYNSLIKEKFKSRNLIKPGITCFSQIYFFKSNNILFQPKAISLDNKHWNRKFTLDIYYYKKKSFCLDIFLIYITFIILFKSIIGYNKDTLIFKKTFTRKK
jgi:lipopolysaccharide/colanic/teichoic acid biosynthesis glycosyltransferase